MEKIRKINDTTYEALLPSGDTVEIGDKSSPNFKPTIKLNRWDGECFIAVQPAGEIEEEVEYEVEGDKIKCKYKVKQGELEFEWETEFYPLEPTTVDVKDKDGKSHPFKQNELGGFEFEIILKKKPARNTIELDIETQGLEFHYQPELSPERVAEGAVRPDNVVGSYAVYHATRGNIHCGEANAEKYKCGKAFHIYRPKVTDARGNWIWGELKLDEQAGTLTITIDQNWLDSALYPVTIDPTFGWTEGGGSAAGYTGDHIWGTHPFSPASSGTVTKLTVRVSIGAPMARPIIYKNSDDTLVGYGDEVDLDASQSNDLALTCSVVGATEYILCVWLDGGADLYYDSHATYKTAKEAETYHSTNAPPSPCGWSAGKEAYAEWLDIYCTYEEEAVGLSIPIAMHHYQMLRGATGD